MTPAAAPLMASHFCRAMWFMMLWPTSWASTSASSSSLATMASRPVMTRMLRPLV